jgi:hypothetical protein
LIRQSNAIHAKQLGKKGNEGEPGNFEGDDMQHRNKITTDLNSYANEYDANEESIGKMFSELKSEKLNWRPNSHQWSVVQCIEHLNVFGRTSLDAIDKMIRDGQSREMYRNDHSVRYGMLGNLLIRSIEPPYRIKFKAVKNIVPLAQDYEPENVLTNLHLLHEELKARLSVANELDFVHIKHPIPPTNIKLPLGQWFALIAAHERRHIWQAQRIVEQLHGTYNP